MFDLKPGERTETPYEHHDDHEGWQRVLVEAYRTTWNGRRVVRYRLKAGRWTSLSSFHTAERAWNHAQRVATNPHYRRTWRMAQA